MELKWVSRGSGRGKEWFLQMRETLPRYQFEGWCHVTVAKVFRTKKTGWYYKIGLERAVSCKDSTEGKAIALALVRFGS